MSKPRFANRWYTTPPVNELRQEIQHIYQQLSTVVMGAADSLDDHGNPTPNPDDFPPSRFTEGALFLATSYPEGVDGGSMQFRLHNGEWVWSWGNYRGSNSNGSYVRDAGGDQRCSFRGSAVTVSSGPIAGWYNSSTQTWTYPVEFSGDEIPKPVFSSDNSCLVSWANATTTGCQYVLWRPASGTGRATGHVEGRWK